LREWFGRQSNYKNLREAAVGIGVPFNTPGLFLWKATKGEKSTTSSQSHGSGTTRQSQIGEAKTAEPKKSEPGKAEPQKANIR
jgi:hypothetical protein